MPDTTGYRSHTICWLMFMDNRRLLIERRILTLKVSAQPYTGVSNQRMRQGISVRPELFFHQSSLPGSDNSLDTAEEQKEITRGSNQLDNRRTR